MPKAFTIVGEEQAPDNPIPQTPAQAQDAANAVRLLMLSLRVVSQRFVTALSHLFTAVGLASAWYLWLKILPNPTITQLVGVGLYAGFLLAIEFVRRMNK